MDGWIKLHRKLLEDPIIEKPACLSLWLIILLLANHEDRVFIWNGENFTCRRGQLITSRLKLSELSKLSPSTVEDVLSYFEKNGKVRQQKNNRFRLITVINYDAYQDFRHQKDTNKKDKKNKNKTTTVEKLEKWLSKMEDVESPEGLAMFYAKKYSDKVISKALNNSSCTSRGSFGDLCKFYFLKENKKEDGQV